MLLVKDPILRPTHFSIIFESEVMRVGVLVPRTERGVGVVRKCYVRVQIENENKAVASCHSFLSVMSTTSVRTF